MPVSGAYRVSFSLFSDTNTNWWNIAYIKINGNRMPETRHDTYSGMHTVYSSSGREWFFEARSGDTISLEITKGGGYYGTVNFCINLMSPESNDQSNRGQGKDLKDLNLELETADGDSLKRPRGNVPNDTEEESPNLDTLTAEPKANEVKNPPRKKSKPKAKKLKPKTERETTNTKKTILGHQLLQTTTTLQTHPRPV